MSNLAAQESLTGIDSLVLFHNSQEKEGRGTLVHITRSMVVFEVYNPYSIVQLSEVLPTIQVLRGDRVIYKGRAVVSHILTTGLMTVVSATLVDTWSDLSGLKPGGALKIETERFIEDWNTSHTLQPKYKLIIGTIRNFLGELSRWLGEAEVESFGDNNTNEFNKHKEEFYQEVKGPITPKFSELFGQFEEEAKQIPPEEVMAHKTFTRRELHPLTMCSPFVHRTYIKPLGYAGDYEMVNMMLRESQTHATGTYARIIDTFHIMASAPEAHRNRIVMLQERLKQEAERVVEDEQRLFTVMNIGCGPAVEVQRFIRDSSIAKQCSFQLMDFNDETLAYAERKIEEAITNSGNKPIIKFINKSIDELLKEAATKQNNRHGSTYDMVYCAGLFDYFSDPICKRLVAMYYSWLRPGGLLAVTNVHIINPNRYHMEHLLEWHLIYRDETSMAKLIPIGANHCITTDKTGMNLFLDIRQKN
ncbi:MAG: class I SAM-dependent methyltransferase [Proteobacteria bacterium]|nr:class I SAM-dependent methyltransferase [Pseudomonadota bacterium]